MKKMIQVDEYIYIVEEGDEVYLNCRFKDCRKPLNKLDGALKIYEKADYNQDPHVKAFIAKHRRH